MLNELELEPWLIGKQLRHSDDGTLVVERYGHPTREGDRAHPPPYGDNLRPLAPVSGDSRGTGARDCGLDRDVRRVDPSGRATVTGDGSTAAGDAILTGRLTAAGAPDPSFGTAGNGRVVIPGAAATKTRRAAPWPGVLARRSPAQRRDRTFPEVGLPS
jgi:hypothetical protein